MKKNDRMLTEKEMDAVVEDQAGDNSAWTAPVKVRRVQPLHLSLPAHLASRIAFLAKLHKARNPSQWVQSVIEDRLRFEESALGGLKQALEESSAQPRAVVAEERAAYGGK